MKLEKCTSYLKIVPDENVLGVCTLNLTFAPLISAVTAFTGLEPVNVDAIDCMLAAPVPFAIKNSPI